ncbi:octopamine receptor beta-1R-like [Clytia hemisphaerica]|uniref:G-protein coupled receptors family 1 profile domain-containing protein n=1 Tax=Clytia hemisphaerica TaxID=252671 RepID=A0A7M5WUV3_9CNID
MCNPRFSLLSEETFLVYGILFILCGIVAAVGNIIAFYILWMPDQRNKSNKILSSLAISDALTGLVVFPINAYQTLSPNARLSCSIDFARAYFALLMSGSSVLTLVVIALDRYILMTRYASYHFIMTERKIVIMLIACWLYPGLTPLLKYAGETPYLINMILIFFGPIILLIILYCLLIRLIYESRKKVIAHASKTTNIVETQDGRLEMAPSSSNLTEADIIDQPTKSKLSPTVSAVSASKKSSKRHMKLAKSVSVLLGCYLICLTPFNLWMILDMVNKASGRISSVHLQHLYMFGVFAGAANSCVNPFIYLSKQPGFRKRFRNILTQISNNVL